MWRAGIPDPVQIRSLRKLREQHDLHPLVIHDSYLINLAACDAELRVKSTAAFRGELERAIAIGADYLVAHPGSCKGHSIEEGIYVQAHAIAEAAKGLDTRNVMLLLENTAGGGAKLGSRFEELRVIREFTSQLTGLRIGYCIDTCHCLASGYDVANAEGLRKTVAEIESILGLEHVKIMHANDSKGALGSRIDRHAHIGGGYIGLEGFRRILNHPQLLGKPFILETPVDQEGDERRNVDTLKSLCRKRRTTTTKLK